MNMTPNAFRKLALSLPEAVEQTHMGHPDFRVGNRIFATLFTRDGEWGMVKLTPAQQRPLVRSHPLVFQPVPGGWGKQGCTRVALAAAPSQPVSDALKQAWRNVAPKQVVEIYAPAAASNKLSNRGGRGAPTTRRKGSRTAFATRRKRS